MENSSSFRLNEEIFSSVRRLSTTSGVPKQEIGKRLGRFSELNFGKKVVKSNPKKVIPKSLLTAFLDGQIHVTVFTGCELD